MNVYLRLFHSSRNSKSANFKGKFFSLMKARRTRRWRNMSNGQTAFFLRMPLVGNTLRSLVIVYVTSARHKIEQLVTAAWHIKDIAQLFLNSSRFLLRACWTHFVSSLNVPTYFLNDIRGSIVRNVYILPCMRREFQTRKEFECKCFGRLGCMFS